MVTIDQVNGQNINSATDKVTTIANFIPKIIDWILGLDRFIQIIGILIIAFVSLVIWQLLEYMKFEKNRIKEDIQRRGIKRAE